jgi:hypothetical protein
MPKRRLDPWQPPLLNLINRAAEHTEIAHPDRFHWDLVRDVPIRLLDPPSREAYEFDPDAEDEDEVQQNLDRYDDLVRLLIDEGHEPWPVVVDAHGFVLDGYHRLAVLSDHGVKAVDVIWVRKK